MSELTREGWPRPIIGGWPIPWVSPSSDLSMMDADRKEAVVSQRLCQVCGEGHPEGGRVFICVGEVNPDPPEDLSDLRALAMDNAIMHERCARLAIARCPRLRALRVEKALVLVSAEVGAVFVVDDEPDSPRLAVEGRDLKWEQM